MRKCWNLTDTRRSIEMANQWLSGGLIGGQEVAVLFFGGVNGSFMREAYVVLPPSSLRFDNTRYSEHFLACFL